MRFQNNFKRVVLPVCVFVLMSFAVNYAQPNAEYKFKVHNNTKNTIKKILVSEDGKTYGFFNIGKGIAPGQTLELVWDKSTDSESCQQYFKAVFDNDEESQPVKFDFCEAGLVLEF